MGTAHILRIVLIILIINTSLAAKSQIWLTGKVYDSTRMVTIPAVKVMTKKGTITFTDSIGRYGLNVEKDDSVSFTYRGKSTNYFPVKQINYPAGFDVALQIVVRDRYQTLREIVVVGKSYREDSIENRERYRKIFDYGPGGLSITSSGYLDPNSLIGAFSFRKNKVMRSFQNRLILEEQEKFVDSRFTKSLVRQITGLKDRDLERFMKLWRPPYELVAFSEEYQFHLYILDASLFFKSGVLPKARTEERGF